MKKIFWLVPAAAVLSSTLWAQSFTRQAVMVGGGDRDRGKCTIEVVVDDVAQVEVRGSTANLRTMSGRPASWRRFECSGPLPANPSEFRFAGVDGRGRQTLIRDPRNGGEAVVQIEDRDSGEEAYTFDLFWGLREGPAYPPPSAAAPPRNDDDRYRPNYRDSDYYRRYRHGFAADEAIRLCQQSVMNMATRRFRSNDLHFNRTRLDESPGRQDRVTGVLDLYRRDHEEQFRFSCLVDFESGRIRTADLDQRPIGDEDDRRR